jgi:hypothetical protein
MSRRLCYLSTMRLAAGFPQEFAGNFKVPGFSTTGGLLNFNLVQTGMALVTKRKWMDPIGTRHSKDVAATGVSLFNPWTD